MIQTILKKRLNTLENKKNFNHHINYIRAKHLMEESFSDIKKSEMLFKKSLFHSTKGQKTKARLSMLASGFTYDDIRNFILTSNFHDEPMFINNFKIEDLKYLYEI